MGMNFSKTLIDAKASAEWAMKLTELAVTPEQAEQARQEYEKAKRLVNSIGCQLAMQDGTLVVVQKHDSA